VDDTLIPFECFPVSTFILEEIEARGYTIRDECLQSFCDELGWSREAFDRVLKTEDRLSFGQAIDLARVFGIPAETWINLQKGYDRCREAKDGPTFVMDFPVVVPSSLGTLWDPVLGWFPEHPSMRVPLSKTFVAKWGSQAYIRTFDPIDFLISECSKRPIGRRSYTRSWQRVMYQNLPDQSDIVAYWREMKRRFRENARWVRDRRQAHEETPKTDLFSWVRRYQYLYCQFDQRINLIRLKQARIALKRWLQVHEDSVSRRQPVVLETSKDLSKQSINRNTSSFL